MDVNNGENALHGGLVGFDKVRQLAVAMCTRLPCASCGIRRQRLWRAETYERANGDVGVVFSLASVDGDQGYPGTVQVRRWPPPHAATRNG